MPVIVFLVYTTLYHLEQLVFFLAFCTPIAVTLKSLGLATGGGPDLSLPTEPVMFLIMVMYILHELGKGISDRRFMRHPVSIIIFIQLLWMFFTTCTSSEVVVSIKYFISRLWFIFSCYLIIPHLFQHRKNIITFTLCYCSSLVIVIFYTLARHTRFNFNDKAADWVVDPFYNDHTAYGAALAIFIPVLLSFLFLKSVPKVTKIICFSLFALFMVAIILSYARAGWLSLFVATAILITFWFKIKFRTLFTTFAAIILIFFAFQAEILTALGRNNQDAKGSLANNLESVSNISTDASNLERLNRWACALRMWEDRPMLGWGPGTYMFKYAPYQLSRNLTIISTNFGDNGNAHSEYLGPLAEQGVPGMLIMVVLLVYCTSMGYRMVYATEDRDTRILIIGLFLGIMTYFVHGFLNNFLDTDKLSLPFWGFLAGLVTIDLYWPKAASANGDSSDSEQAA